MSSWQDRLTEEQIAEFQETFSFFDRQGNGIISPSDFGRVMSSLGINHNETELKDLMEEVDCDGSGKINFDGFLKLMSHKMKECESTDELKEAFAAFDKNGDGFVTTDELYRVMTTLGEKLSEEEVSELIKEADVDGDGKVSYEGITFFLFICFIFLISLRCWARSKCIDRCGAGSKFFDTCFFYYQFCKHKN